MRVLLIFEVDKFFSGFASVLPDGPTPRGAAISWFFPFLAARGGSSPPAGRMNDGVRLLALL
jgi:hypothetical protein